MNFVAQIRLSRKTMKLLEQDLLDCKGKNAACLEVSVEKYCKRIA